MEKAAKEPKRLNPDPRLVLGLLVPLPLSQTYTPPKSTLIMGLTLILTLTPNSILIGQARHRQAASCLHGWPARRHSPNPCIHIIFITFRLTLTGTGTVTAHCDSASPLWPILPALAGSDSHRTPASGMLDDGKDRYRWFMYPIEALCQPSLYLSPAD